MTDKAKKIWTNVWLLTVWGAAMGVAGWGITYRATGDQFERELGCKNEGSDRSPTSILRNRIDAPTDTNKGVSLDSLLTMKAGAGTKLWKLGDGGTVVGTVLDVVLGGEEASNCNSIVADRQTVYLYLVPKAKLKEATKSTAMRIAITPRMRLMKAKSKLDWSFAELSKLKGKDILATGWLYYDKPQEDYAADNDKGVPGRNVWIKTCWSLYPVTDLKEFAP